MSESTDPLLTSFDLGGLKLPNRIIMAPMTRSRAGEGNVATALNAEYYKQRASAGLIITEGTQISEQAKGYPYTSGIHSEAQIEGWKKVTHAVHEADGRIFAQIWHVGRMSHPYFQDGDKPVAPSAVKPGGQAFTPKGMKDYVEPRALETDEISGIIEDYAQAARNAIAAGFDGVEIHGANGYLIDQFIQDGTNKRVDRYGGSVENRAQFALEVTHAVTDAVGAEKVGLRLSPSSVYNDMNDSNPKHTFTYLVTQLNDYDLAYLHFVEPITDVSGKANYLNEVAPYFRTIYEGTIITCGGYNKKSGNQAIKKNKADMVGYAQLFIANPDLPKRFAADASLNEANRDTYYGGGEKGYTDYPAIEDERDQKEVA